MGYRPEDEKKVKEKKGDRKFTEDERLGWELSKQQSIRHKLESALEEKDRIAGLKEKLDSLKEENEGKK